MTETPTAGNQPITLPSGVKLTSWDDFSTRRQNIFDSVKSTFATQFPVSYGGVKLDLHEPHYDNEDTFNVTDYKKALMEGKYLARRLRGTLRLTDEKTGEVLGEKLTTLMRVPYLTDHGSFLHNGSEYTTLMQARLRPGIYTRRKASGEIESHVNTRRGTGSSFRVRLEPDSGLFKMDIGQSSLRLYSLLKDLGVPDEQLEKTWGPELLKKNQEGYDSRVFDKAYARLVRKPDPNASREQRAQAIKDALAATKVDRGVLERTLPNLMAAKRAAKMVKPLEGMDSDLVKLADFLNVSVGANIDLTQLDNTLANEVVGHLQAIEPGLTASDLLTLMDQVKEAATSSKGCLMARISPEAAAPIIEWTEDNIPAEDLSGDGVERESHVTIRYGFTGECDVSELAKAFKDYGKIKFVLRNTRIFRKANGGKEDCLVVVDVESPDLVAMREMVDENFDDVLDKPTYPEYKPHLSLAYVRCGSVDELENHARFDGQIYVVTELVYSSAGSKEKTVIPLV